MDVREKLRYCLLTRVFLIMLTESDLEFLAIPKPFQILVVRIAWKRPLLGVL